MAYVAISSDLAGNIFSVDHDGLLRRNEQRPNGGPMVYPGLGPTIGMGWAGVTELSATRTAGQLVVAGTTEGGQLLSAQTSIDSLAAWTTATPTRESSFVWQPLRAVFGGLNGQVYGVDPQGHLLRVQFVAATGAGRGRSLALAPFHPTASTDLGGGFDDSATAFTNGTIIFDVTWDGDLRYRIDAGERRNADRQPWVVLDRAWSAYQRVLGAGDGGIYTISAEGDLELHQFVFDGGNVRLLRRATRNILAHGFVGWAGVACRVEGYCRPQSIKPGGRVSFKVAPRLTPPRVILPVPYTVQFVRLRRIRNGKVHNYDDLLGGGPNGLVAQPLKRPLPADWLEKGAQWPQSFSFTVPSSWRSGLYAARCTAENHSFYIPFVVRPRTKSSPFAIIANTNTWNAYNCWGGQGKYAHVYPLPTMLPFDRPHPGLTPNGPKGMPKEIITQSGHLLRAELWVLGWLDGLGPGYAYDMFTDRDLHDGIPGLATANSRKRYKALILNTHPEYWTTEMYDRVKAYQQLGGSIVYLGGNGIYEFVEFGKKNESLRIFPGVDWTMVPCNATNEQVRLQCTTRSRGRPERALIGVGFEGSVGAAPKGQAYLLELPPSKSPALAGLKLKVGDSLGASSANCGFQADGWEVDQRGKGTPDIATKDDALLALGGCHGMSGEMIYYETGHGGVVFSGASLTFGGSLAVDKNLQRIVKNVLDISLTR